MLRSTRRPLADIPASRCLASKNLRIPVKSNRDSAAVPNRFGHNRGNYALGAGFRLQPQPQVRQFATLGESLMRDASKRRDTHEQIARVQRREESKEAATEEPKEAKAAEHNKKEVPKAETRKEEAPKEESNSKQKEASGPAEDIKYTPDVEYTPEEKQNVVQQILNLRADGYKMNAHTVYLLYKEGKLLPKRPINNKEMKFDEYEKVYKETIEEFNFKRRRDLQKKRRARRNYAQLNTGYEEPDETFEAHEDIFQNERRTKSIAEDARKAEIYDHMCDKALADIAPRPHDVLSDGEDPVHRGDRLFDVYASAFRREHLEKNRPVLAHELSDYENPYMMKRSALERVLQEKCVRNQLEERVMPQVLNEHPSLVKLRSKATLPPEIFEPLAAFRGDTNWSFDSRKRLEQKVSGLSTALDVITTSPEGGKEIVEETRRALEHKQPVGNDEINHPWRNHFSFESEVPRGVTGGLKFGEPSKPLEEEILKTRYPTLQRVAHTLPKDPKWRSHVVRTIEVLERSKDWDYQSKLDAVNKMKDIYDGLKPSQDYTDLLEEKLPVNRVPSHLKRKLAKDKDYVKTYPKRFMLRKSFLHYRSSLTATKVLKVSDSKKKFKLSG